MSYGFPTIGLAVTSKKLSQQKKIAKVSGFAIHTRVENALRERQTELSLRRRVPLPERKGPGGPKEMPSFIENVGAFRLFSIAEAERMSREAESIFGKDGEEYVRQRIAAAVAKGARRSAGAPPKVETLAELRADFPHFGHVVDEIERAAAQSSLMPRPLFQMSPLGLVGDPGVGKSAFLNRLARAIGVPFQRLDVGTLSTGSEICGTSLSWSTGRTGMIFNTLVDNDPVNPIIFLDELDKAQGNHQAPVIPPLLALLEQETAVSFRDEAVGLPLDASHILWVAAANELSRLSAPLRSRLMLFEIRKPTGTDAVRVCRSIYRSLRHQNPWGSRFTPDLDKEVIDRLIDWYPREMSLLLRRGFGEAARRGRDRIAADDLIIPAREERRHVGFI